MGHIKRAAVDDHRAARAAVAAADHRGHLPVRDLDSRTSRQEAAVHDKRAEHGFPVAAADRRRPLAVRVDGERTGAFEREAARGVLQRNRRVVALVRRVEPVVRPLRQTQRAGLSVHVDAGGDAADLRVGQRHVERAHHLERRVLVVFHVARARHDHLLVRGDLYRAVREHGIRAVVAHGEIVEVDVRIVSGRRSLGRPCRPVANLARVLHA